MSVFFLLRVLILHSSQNRFTQKNFKKNNKLTYKQNTIFTHKVILKSIFLFLLTLSSFVLTAQEYITNVQHYLLDKGLETRDIKTAFKDSQGFMWFGTDLGAYRFDGYEFKHFPRNKTTTPLALTDQITEDDEKNIWFNHPNPNARKDINDILILPFGRDTLVSISDFFGEKLPFPIEEISRFDFQRTTSLIWITSKQGLVYEYSKGVFTKILDIASHPFKPSAQKYWTYIRKDKNGNLWIGTYSKLFKIAPNGKFEKEISLPAYIIFELDPFDRVWLSNYERGVFLLEEDSLIKKFPFIDPSVHRNAHFYKDPQYPYIIASKNNKTFNFTLYNTQNEEKIDFAQMGIESEKNTISSFFIENENTIWVCTFNGIYRVHFSKNPFFQYINEKSTRGIIRGNDDKIWVASYSGFYELDPLKNNTAKLIDKKIKVGQGITKDNKNDYWMGYMDSRIYKFKNTNFKEAKNYKLKADVNIEEIYTVHQDIINETYWAGTQRGLYHYNLPLDSFIIYPKTNGFDEINSSLVRDFEEVNNSKNLLVASSKGIFQIDYNKGITQHYCTQNNNFPFDYINFIHTDLQDGTLWIGTAQGGLIHWDFPSGKPRQFTTKDGLTDNMIYAVYEDEHGFLWLPSNNGLMRFNKKTQEINTFTANDGIAHNEFNYTSHFQDKDGKLYFGGLNGITAFYPKEINLTNFNAKVYLTNIETLNFQTGEMISMWDDYQQAKSIEFNTNDKSIKLSFALLDYDDPDQNNFVYKIDGLENNWNNIDGHSLRFNGLPYGEYTLLIKGKDAHGQWSNEILEIPVHIIQPIYKTWWFLAIATLLFIWVAVKLVSYRRTALLTKRNLELEEVVSRRTEELKRDKEVIEKQAEELQKLDALKTQFFANVTHELRTPLSLIIGPLKHLMNTTQLDEKTLRSLKAIAQNGETLKDLVEEILDLSRYDLQKLQLNKQPVHFLSKIKKCAAGFDIQAQQREIDFQLLFQLPLDIQLNVDSKKIQKIVTNLLSNAFKFSKCCDRIILNISEHKNEILIQVTDSGPGISEEELPKIFDRFYQSEQNRHEQNGGLGIGLALSRGLAELMGGTLTATSTIGKGSTFTLKFPKEESFEQIVQQKEIETILAGVSDEKPSFNKNKNTVLIVEDTPGMQVFIQDLLSPHVNTIIANHGIHALQILNKNDKIDLIISDIMMPEMDGFTLLDKLKSDERFQSIPVIILTALTSKYNKDKAITFGVDDYLIKPFEPEELTARVSSLLENAALRKETFEEEPVSSDDVDTNPNLPQLESADLKWLKQLETMAFEKVTTPNFKIGQLAFEMAIGERQLNRKVKKITGLTPGNYLKEIKLQKARQLLENKAYSTVSEVSYLIGFSTPQYFSKLYKARFGKLPSDYFK